MKQTAIVMTDQQTLLLKVKSVLGKDCHVPTLNSLDEAWSLYESIPNSIGLVLIDIDLPGLHLKETVSRLHQISYTPEIIVISRKEASLKECREALKLGVFDYLKYPFADPELKACTDKAIYHSDTLRKLNRVVDENFLSSFAKRLELAHEIATQRRSHGQALSEEDLLAFFPIHGHNRDVMEEILTEFKSKSSTGSSKNPVVLAVDDEIGVRNRVEDFLLHRDYKPLLASTPSEALKLAKEHPEIDVLLLDIGLPEMSGIELLNELKKILPHTEAVMLTAYSELEKVRESFKGNAFDYVTKPFNSVDLGVTLSKALQRRYFNKVLAQDGASFFDKTISMKARLKILNDIAHKRLEENQPFFMEDIYAFLPELKRCELEPSKVVSKTKIQDGLLLFIDELFKKSVRTHS